MSNKRRLFKRHQELDGNENNEGNRTTPGSMDLGWFHLLRQHSRHYHWQVYYTPSLSFGVICTCEIVLTGTVQAKTVNRDCRYEATCRRGFGFSSSLLGS